MTNHHLQAGARVRIVIETTVESVGDNELTLTGDTHITYQPDQLDITILEPGWQPGDIVDDGHGPLGRVCRADGTQHWVRIADGHTVWDDETNLAALTVISRAATEEQR